MAATGPVTSAHQPASRGACARALGGSRSVHRLEVASRSSPNANSTPRPALAVAEVAPVSSPNAKIWLRLRRSRPQNFRFDEERPATWRPLPRGQPWNFRFGEERPATSAMTTVAAVMSTHRSASQGRPRELPSRALVALRPLRGVLACLPASVLWCNGSTLRIAPPHLCAGESCQLRGGEDRCAAPIAGTTNQGSRRADGGASEGARRPSLVVGRWAPKRPRQPHAAKALPVETPTAGARPLPGPACRASAA